MKQICTQYSAIVLLYAEMHEICKYAQKPENMQKYATLYAAFWNPQVMIGGDLKFQLAS